MLTRLFPLIFASGSLLAARSAQLGMRIVILLLIAACGREADLASASYALALAEIGRGLADFGTDTWSIRAITLARDGKDENRIVTAVGLIKIVGWLIVGTGIYLTCYQKLPTGGGFGILSATLVLTSQAVGLAVSYFQAKGEVGKLRRMLFPCIGTAVAAVVSFLLTRSAAFALTTIVAGEIYTSTTLLVLVYGCIGRPDLTHIGAQVLRVARQCIPAAAFNVVAALSARLDTLVLAQFSLRALAAYTVVQRLFQPFLVLATSFSPIVYRRTAHALANERPFVRELVTRDGPLIMGIAIALAAILLGCGAAFLEQVVPQYRSLLGPLMVLCFTLPVLAYNAAASGLLQGFGRYWSLLLISTVDLTLMYILMSHWAPRYGAAGIVAGLLAGALFNGLAQTVAALLTIRWKRSCLPPLSAHST